MVIDYAVPAASFLLGVAIHWAWTRRRRYKWEEIYQRERMDFIHSARDAKWTKQTLEDRMAKIETREFERGKALAEIRRRVRWVEDRVGLRPIPGDS